MKSILMHTDTLMHPAFSKDPEADLYEIPNAMLDIRRMKESGVMANFFAIFLIPEAFYTYQNMEIVPDEEYIRKCSEIFERSIKNHSDIVGKATTAEEILQNERNGKVSAVLTMEDGVAVQGKIENLKRYYDMGVRALSLTWNFENCFGYPNSTDPQIMSKGLKAFGKEAVFYMQDLGMMVDVSHLSDGGFYDVAEICKKPFVATHSNCRTLSPHPRNLTDDMIRILAEHGGVMGLNFGPEFLNEDLENKKSTVERLAAMAHHAAGIGGADVVAIGTDFDGIGGELEIGSCDKLDLLADELSKAGFSGGEIEKIFYKNVLRVMEDTVK